MARTARFGSIRHLPSGRWQARYTHGGTTKKAPNTFATEDQAQKWLRLRQAELESGVTILAKPKRTGGTTFETYANRWLDARELKPRTRVLYRGQLDRHLLPAFGKRALTTITRDVVGDWWSGLDPAKPTLRAHLYALLRAILNGAVEDGLIDANPAHVRGGSRTRRRHRIEPATPEELAVIVENMPERLRAAVLIAAWGGLRFGEWTELRRGDIDVVDGVIHVTRAVVRLPGDDPEEVIGRRRPRFVVGTPKSEAGIRDVHLPASVMPAIRAHLDAMEDKRSTALLFPADSGEHLATSTWDKAWRPAREAAGRPDLRQHDLRHTQAVYAAQAGATLAELMARLGHSTPVAALRYQHAARGRDFEIAARLDEIARPKV